MPCDTYKHFVCVRGRDVHGMQVGPGELSHRLEKSVEQPGRDTIISINVRKRNDSKLERARAHQKFSTETYNKRGHRLFILVACRISV